MNTSARNRRWLFATTAVALMAAGQAAAQTAANANALEEVVVTATRQASTVNRVPLSITATTQQSLDQRGIKSVGDLQRIVPALVVTRDFAGTSNYIIRGIVSTNGAATTGIYVNDTPLQKRRVPGAVNAANGGPSPPLFDLERVEVLRGPQGTLYGGSSEGGTIRFITPQPSLTTFSVYSRGEISTVKAGGTGYEGGVAVGGPIVKDKLGFRASAFRGHSAGYIDIVDPYNNGAVRFKDANSEDTKSFRVAVAWAPVEQARITLSAFKAQVSAKGGPEAWLLPQPAGKTYTTPQTCYDTRLNARLVPPRAANCAVTTAPFFARPAQTYGPFDYLQTPYQSFQQNLFPNRTNTSIYDLTLEYNFEHMTAKSITSYIEDETKSYHRTNAELRNQQATTDFPGAIGFPLYRPWPEFDRLNNALNRRHGLVQEFRFASANSESPLTWVAGVYYSVFNDQAQYRQVGDIERFAREIFGQPNALTAFGSDTGTTAVHRIQLTEDNEIAAFGEANYAVTEKLKVIAGVRASRVGLKYHQNFYGTIVGWGNVLDPRGLVDGNGSESPVTPKLGVQYQITPNDLLYLSASKGFRAGGVNPIPLEILCGAALANLGLKVTDISPAYGSDSIWSYEAGAKMRLFNGRMQVNSSAFKIDWSQLQLTVPNLGSGCGGGWVQNAGRAVSQGFDIDVNARLVNHLSVNLAMGKTDAHYTESATLPTPLNGAAPTTIVRKGDPLPVPEWQVSVGLQFDTQISGKYKAYARGDYSYGSSYWRSTVPGVTGYAADSARADSVQRVNVRAGVGFGRWDVNVFANNLLNSDDFTTKAGGRTGCAVATGAACTTFTGYDPFITGSQGRPREIGIQTTYRY